MKKSWKESSHIVIICIAAIFVLFGFCVPFININSLGGKIENDGYVGAVFALSGVFVFFAALLYQIKEYKLQVFELRKSVEAQTRSSDTLDEQKKLLLEQNSSQLIFGMIQNFNEFKEKNAIKTVVNRLKNANKEKFELIFNRLFKEGSNREDEFYDMIVSEILSEFKISLNTNSVFFIFEKYFQFSSSILYTIEKMKGNISHDFFRPFFFMQLSKEEQAFLFLANYLHDFRFQQTSALKFNAVCVLDLFEVVYGVSNVSLNQKAGIAQKIAHSFNKHIEST